MDEGEAGRSRRLSESSSEGGSASLNDPHVELRDQHHKREENGAAEEHYCFCR